MKKGYLYIVLTAFLFSTMEIALKITVGQFNPIQLTFLRFLIGSVILFPLAVRGLSLRKCRLQRADFGFFALAGWICVVVSMVLYQMAIVYTKASIVAVLFSCNPVFVVVFAYFFLHEPIRRYTVISIGLSILGILWIIDPMNFSGSPAGIGLALFSALTFGLYGVMGRKRSQRYGGFALTCFSFLFGCLELLLLIYTTRIDAAAAFLTRNGLQVFAEIPLFQGITLQSLPSLVYIGVFVTGLGYTFYFLGMEETSAATVSLVFFIKPMLAPLLALLVLHEPITVNMAGGIMVIVAGSLISLIPALKTNRSQETVGKKRKV